MYIHADIHTYIRTCVRTYVCVCITNIGLVTGPGGLFATRLVTESGGLATNPPLDKLIEDYSTLHRGPRQWVCNGGPTTKVCNRGGGGTATKPYFESQPHMEASKNQGPYYRPRMVVRLL